MLMGWHGRATTGTGRAFTSGFRGFWEVRDWHDHATTSTGCATISGQWHQFFLLFRIMFGQIPTKQIKITQNKQNKSNKNRGLPPMKRSFKVISLKVIRFLYLIPNLSQRDKGIKLTLSPKLHDFLNGFRSYDTRYGKTL